MPIPPTFYADLADFVRRWDRSEQYLGDNPFPRFFHTARADSWDAIESWLAQLNGLGAIAVNENRAGS